ncbi:MAG: hypothetical protein A2Z18_10725 [Armatimonadetes bacterium RBG_16_58_9]|nr:MAG: hypothetical protein A2Z18_10725 [Armatimonadetes bacterium RBG_16_58_9]
MNIVQRNSARIGFSLIEIMVVIMVLSLLVAMAVPHFIRARDSSRGKACTQNLREFETAKEQWAMNTRAAASETPAVADLVTEYMKGTEDTLPLCPSSGSYQLNDLGTLPTCDIGDNGTVEDWDDHRLLQ